MVANASPDLPPIRRVGFIGLGNIGSPMAMRIADAGRWDYAVWNRDRAKSQPFAAREIAVADSPAALAIGRDLVCLCVTDTDAVEQVVFGSGGVAEGLAPGTIVADHSTISPERTRGLAARLAERCGAHWVDAPVSGGVPGAIAGTLAVMAGGDAGAVARATPVLRAFGGQVTHMGPAGCGQATKACNQLINVGTIAVVGEAMNLAARWGLDARRLPEALAGGFADSNILRNYAPKLAEGTYGANGVTNLTLKDLGIVLDMGRQCGAPLPVISLLESLLRALVSQGFDSGGMAGLMRLYSNGPLPRPPHAGG